VTADRFDDTATVYGLLCATTARWPDRPFLNVLPETAGIYGIESRKWTYREALAEVERLKARYSAAGYQPGGRVLLLLENRPSYFLHWFALNAIGLSVVPINPDLQSSELEYIAAHAEPVLAVVTDARVADIVAASRASGGDFPVIGPDDMPPPQIETVPRPVAERPLDRETAMLYTSGTTGKPKGCVLSNLYFLAAGHWYSTAGGYYALSEHGECLITPLPIFHMNPMAYSLMAMISVGGCLTVLDRFHPKTWWKSVRESGATGLHYLGVMPAMLMSMPSDPDDRNHSVRFGFGAGIDKSLHGPFEERFGFPLVEAWAMTETGAGAVIAANFEPRKRGTNCLGRPRGGVEVRIVTDDGGDAGADEPGELLVRHAGENPRYGFFTEYYGNPEATEDAWADGWFHTGDIVRRDADGDVFFVDRKKNVIRRSGENISAVEVESVLSQYPGVNVVAVAPVPDAVRGDEVFALIVLNAQGDAVRAQDIVHWSLTRMAYYKAPGYIAFVEDIPITATQKIKRGDLKDLAAKLLSEGRAIDLRSLKKRRQP
jgi:acyl-CoA synthetase (AMP-forming)/AMP-acid ligase II